MNDRAKTNQELIQENATLKQKIQELELAESGRKWTEKLLRDYEERYRALFDRSLDLVYIMDFEGRFIDANDGALNRLGYTREEIHTLNFASFLDEDQLLTAFKTLQEIRETGIHKEMMEFRLRHKNGSFVYVETRGSTIMSNGKPVAIQSIARDITERKQAEEALRESEDMMRYIVRHDPSAVAVYDLDLHYIAVSDRYLQDYNVKEADIIGKHHYDVFPEMPQKWRDVHERCLSGAIERNDDDHFERPDGSITYNRWECRPWYRANGKIAGMITYTEVTTERKRAEEERKVLKERLQRAEKMEAIGTLAGGVAHDLNNVLGIVVGYAEILLDEIEESSPLRDDVMKIMEGGQRSAAIVQDLLTLARRGVQARKVFNLNGVIKECQKTPEFEKVISFNPKVQIKTDLEADLLNIMGSPLHLAKTILNLVTNAVEAMPGGGTLTISTRNQSLDKPVSGYDAVKEGDYIVLSITDTGEGISDSHIKYIFEPFYTKKVMGRSGTGLGLAVVWGTVKDHNGYIDVQSEVGKGTTFTLYFPVTREEIAKEATIPLSDYIGKDESILVIDDIKEQRELAAKMLGKLNYRVKTVSSGEEAVESLRIKKVDLIVLDMIMDPGMDGLDTYKAIVEIHPQQKAIIVSGFSETERVRDALALGAGDYLRKPYIIEKLGLAVRKELDRKE